MLGIKGRYFPFVENFAPFTEKGVTTNSFLVLSQMKWLKALLPQDKLGWVELLFFLIYFLVFRILTAMEFSLVETHSWQHFRLDLPLVMRSGLMDILPFWLCYRWLILGLLFRKRYLAFGLGFLVFLCTLNGWHTFFNDLVKHGGGMHALVQVFRWQTLLYVSFVYMLRELLVLLALAYFLRSVRLETQKMASELEQLKAQLQPHFFFNTLNTIYSFALEGSALTAPLVAAHADVMRYILYQAQAPMVPLVNEVDFIRNYVSAEELRYGEKVRVNLEVQGLTSLMIEPLLLFPFVENAFKHGAAAEQLSGFIDITIVQIAHELTFVVRNSRSGLKKTGGIGLLNAKKRLELLYPGAYRLEIKQEPISWTVELCIKLPE